MTTYQGWVRGGTIILEGGLTLPDGTRVSVVPEAGASSMPGVGEIVDPAYRLGENAVDIGITDISAEHDHYINGTPKGGDSQGRTA